LAETSGLVAYDFAGGHNGTYVGGVTLAQPGVPLAGFGIPSYAAVFNGSSGYVDIPEAPFNLTGAMTAVAWVKVASISHFPGLIGHGNSSWWTSIDSGGHPGGADGSSASDATSATSIAGTDWHQVAFTYTGASGVANNASFYLDGLLKANSTFTTPPGNGLDVWIGGSPDYGTGRLLAGSIAHAAVFPNALSAAQVALYNSATNIPSVMLRVVPASGANQTLTWATGTLLRLYVAIS
jgi:Concanavalin A-like lectin/glucanases superfamily